MTGEALAAFLLGRLTQEGHAPITVLRVTQGRLPVPGSGQALAVAGGRLWLAHAQLIGGPSIADVPIGDVRGADVREVRRVTGSRRVLTLQTANGTLTFTTVDGEAACDAFLLAVRDAQAGTTTTG